MENKNQTLLKVGENIVFAQHGIDYSMKSGSVYTVSYDAYSDEIQLHEAPNLQLPSKLYVLEEDKKFMNKVLNYHKKNKNGITGVMLAGLKGSGKTVMAKEIAINSGLPILLIDNSFRPSKLTKLFNKLQNIEMCVIFDEIDKLGEDYSDDYMLRVFDGISSSGKHLVLATCNDKKQVNEYLLDRCGRIRYYREFEEMGSKMITSVLRDKLNDKKEVDSCTEFIIKNFNVISFDNVSSFADEVNDYPTETYESLFADMNISSK